MRYINPVGGPAAAVATSKRDRPVPGAENSHHTSSSQQQQKVEHHHSSQQQSSSSPPPPLSLKVDVNAPVCATGAAGGAPPPKAEESPPKRMKTETGSSPRREFGAELHASDNNGTTAASNYHNDNSKRSTMSSSSSTSTLSNAQQMQQHASSNPSGEDHTAITTTSSSVASVKNLRGWLDEFGKQNQKHYEKQVKTPSTAELEPEPVRRPKVHRSTAPPSGPTPLPTVAALAFQKRMSVDPATGKPKQAKAATTATQGQSRCSSKVHGSITPARTVRLVQRPVAAHVQATNDGYASVAELSKWLADDPTSTKKPKHIRRGANIVAKSRKFDKMLQDSNCLVVEDDGCVERSSVTQKKVWLEKALSEDSNEDATETDSTATTHKESHSDKNASMSVSEKKKWLSSAFQSNGGGSITSVGSSSSSNKPPLLMKQYPPKNNNNHHKAWTEVLFSPHDASSRAKDVWCKQPNHSMDAASSVGSMGSSKNNTTNSMWRSNSFQTKAAPPPPAALAASTTASVTEKTLSEDDSSSTLDGQQKQLQHLVLLESMSGGGDGGGVPTEVHVGGGGGASFAASSSSFGGDVDGDGCNLPEDEMQSVVADAAVSSKEEATQQQKQTEDEAAVDFRKARELLVQRSKANGCDVAIVSKVNRRAAKFERLAKEERRRSSSTFGLLKPTWEEPEEDANAPPGAYVKNYCEDAPAKKSLEDLP